MPIVLLHLLKFAHFSIPLPKQSEFVYFSYQNEDTSYIHDYVLAKLTTIASLTSLQTTRFTDREKTKQRTQIKHLYIYRTSPHGSESLCSCREHTLHPQLG